MFLRFPGSPCGVARWLRLQLAAALVLLVPLALYPTWADAPRPGIFDDDNDIDDDAYEIQIHHGTWIAGDGIPVVGVPVPRLIARSQPPVGPLVTAWPGRAADERAPPRA
jgi:hypothetical protein